MPRKMGRPKADNPKNVFFSVKVDANMNNRLVAYCEKHGITKGEAIRIGIELLLSKE